MNTEKCDFCYAAVLYNKAQGDMQRVMNELFYPFGREGFVEEFNKRFGL